MALGQSESRGPVVGAETFCRGVVLSTAKPREYTLSPFCSDLDVYWRYHKGYALSITPEYAAGHDGVSLKGFVLQSTECLGQLSDKTPCSRCMGHANHARLLAAIVSFMQKHDLFIWYEMMSRADNESAEKWHATIAQGRLLAFFMW